MRPFSRLLLVLAGLCLPLSALAAAPEAVTNLKAEKQAEAIHLTWDAPEDESDIAFYRVYFSRESILDNNGAYDDFAATSDKTTEFDLTDFPGGEALYIAILAVNSAGEEMDTFTEEVRVALSDSAPAPASSAPSIPAQPEQRLQQLVEVQRVSATELLLTFSAPVELDRAQAANALRVIDGSDKPLTLTRLAIDGVSVIVTTAPQAPNTTYTVRVDPVVTGKGTDGTVLTLDADHSTLTFTTGSEAVEQPAEPEAKPDGTPPPDVDNFEVRGEEQLNGRYLIMAVWDQPEADTVASYQVQQSLDGGRTYGAVQTLDASTRVIRLREVRPGTFALRIRTVGHNGIVSPGAVAAGQLRITTHAASTTKASVTGSVKPQNGLTDSGPGLVALLAVSGAAAGWYWSRRKKAPATVPVLA